MKAMMEKVRGSGSLQLAVLILVSVVGMLVVEQWAGKPAPQAFVAFGMNFLWYVAGRRAEASGRHEGAA